MLWTISKFDKIELPTEDIQIPDIIEYLPNFMDDTKEYIKSAKLRSKSDILDYTDLIYRLHWAVRNEELERKIELNPSATMERHYAITWITNYEGLKWDEITTDT